MLRLHPPQRPQQQPRQRHCRQKQWALPLPPPPLQQRHSGRPAKLPPLHQQMVPKKHQTELPIPSRTRQQMQAAVLVPAAQQSSGCRSAS